jgi:hypothetical protein
MDGEGKLLGWAFGEELRRDEPGYFEGLRPGALKEAEEDAGRKASGSGPAAPSTSPSPSRAFRLRTRTAASDSSSGAW